jgi:hypothetical protein
MSSATIINNIKNKLCIHECCDISASFGVVGSSKKEFCASHAKKEHMCNFPNKRYLSVINLHFFRNVNM